MTSPAYSADTPSSDTSNSQLPQVLSNQGWQTPAGPQDNVDITQEITGDSNFSPFAASQQQHPQHERTSSEGNSALIAQQQSVPIPQLPINSIEHQGRGPLRQSSISSLPPDQKPMVVNATGPMSHNVVVPQRPRPGRKPIPQEDAADRRRLQNRLAQRNFRDKRQQKLAETQQELCEVKRHARDEQNKWERSMEDLRQQAQALSEQLNAATRRANAAEQRSQDLEKQLKAAQHAATAQSSFSTPFRSVTGALIPPNPTHPVHASVPTPPEDSAFETDFTNYGRPARTLSYQSRAAASNDNATQMDYSMDVDNDHDRCGFCTDDQNCACKPAAKAEPNHNNAAAATAAATISRVTGPGSCDMCRADPRRAQACRDMASSAQSASRTSSSGGNTNATTPRPFDPRPLATPTGLPSVSMPPPPRMSCSTMVDQFQRYGARTSSIASLLNGVQLNTYPAANGGYEMEEQQAAEVLSNLSRRSTGADSSPVDDKQSMFSSSRKDSSTA